MRQHAVLVCSTSIAFLFGCGAPVDGGAADEREATAAQTDAILFPGALPTTPPTATPTVSPPVAAPVSPPVSPPVLAHEYADLRLVGTPIQLTDLSGNDTFVSIEVMNIGNKSTNAGPG